jgi:hypothetical protein
MASSQS